MEVRERASHREIEDNNNNNNNKEAVIEKNGNAVQSKNKDARPLVFKEKEFKIRESLLTTMFREGETRVVYNFISGMFVLFLLRALVDDVITHGIPFHHTWLIWWNFAHFPSTMAVWAMMSLSTLVPYYGMKLWAEKETQDVSIKKQWPALAAYLVYLFAFFYFPLSFLFSWKLNCACSFIITCESTRIAMKMHSFIRENYSRAVMRKLGNTSDADFQWPTLQQFFYFQFCPSFIYRDEYPRTESRDWGVVFYHLGHCFALIEFVNLAFTQYVFPWLSALQYSSLSTTSAVLSLFAAVLPGIICLVCLFYGLLHSWLNAFSEMLRFGDRQFYLNWWNSDNMAEYYRNWNLVVHDWLYAYVYRDVAKLIGGRKGLKWAQLAVFFLSAVFHEYWFGVAFRVFYPVMFMLYFVFGGIFFSVSRLIKNKSIWNTALWFNLLIGTGMFVAFYGQEWYARTRCAPYSSRIIDNILPRHWSCQEIDQL